MPVQNEEMTGQTSDVAVRRVATCKPGKPGLTSLSETLALFLGTGPTKWFLEIILLDLFSSFFI